MPDLVFTMLTPRWNSWGGRQRWEEKTSQLVLTPSWRGWGETGRWEEKTSQLDPFAPGRQRWPHQHGGAVAGTRCQTTPQGRRHWRRWCKFGTASPIQNLGISSPDVKGMWDLWRCLKISCSEQKAFGSLWSCQQFASVNIHTEFSQQNNVISMVMLLYQRVCCLV